jgi:hypothetical protein
MIYSASSYGVSIKKKKNRNRSKLRGIKLIKRINMKKINYIIAIGLISIFINSCIKEEAPVTPYPRGNEIVTTIDMTSKYTNQFYFSFKENKIVKSNQYDIWDLAFQSNGDSLFILLNGAKFMEAADMGVVPFESVTSRKEAQFKYDSTNGDYSKYSIGKWWNENSGKIESNNHVFIVNRGNNDSLRKIGYVKLQILGFENNQYKIKFANLDGSNENTVTIPKKAEYNYIMLSFDDGGKILDLEPEISTWDIMFTKYIAFLVYNDGLLPYSVTGVMINSTQVLAVLDSTRNFADIKYEDIPNYKFSNKPDVVGYDWKSFTINGESYHVKPYFIYILKDTKGFYWKFHFIDFYNDKGERGYPKLEIKLL